MKQTKLINIVFMVLFSVIRIYGADFAWQQSLKPNIYARGCLKTKSELWVLNQYQGGNHLLRTLDGGSSWQELCPSKALDHWQPRLFNSIRGAYILINGSSVWASSDAEKWSQLDVNTSNAYILAYAQQALFALSKCDIAQFPIPVKPSGPPATPDSGVITAIRNIDVNSIIIVQKTTSLDEHKEAKSTIIKMENAGGWKVVSTNVILSADIPEIDYLDCSSHIRFWASSERFGGLYETVDGGAQWQRLISFPDRAVGPIYFDGKKFGRVFASSMGCVYDTYDGGKTWNRLDNDYVASTKFMTDFNSNSTDAIREFSVINILMKSILSDSRINKS